MDLKYLLWGIIFMILLILIPDLLAVMLERCFFDTGGNQDTTDDKNN